MADRWLSRVRWAASAALMAGPGSTWLGAPTAFSVLAWLVTAAVLVAVAFWLVRALVRGDNVPEAEGIVTLVALPPRRPPPGRP